MFILVVFNVLLCNTVKRKMDDVQDECFAAAEFKENKRRRRRKRRNWRLTGGHGEVQPALVLRLGNIQRLIKINAERLVFRRFQFNHINSSQEESRAEQRRTEPGQAEPGRPESSRAEPS